VCEIGCDKLNRSLPVISYGKSLNFLNKKRNEQILKRENIKIAFRLAEIAVKPLRADQANY
jgi:hypothetical protein